MRWVQRVWCSSRRACWPPVILLAVIALAGCGTPKTGDMTFEAVTNLPPVEIIDRLRINDEVVVEFKGVPNPPPAHIERVKEDGTIKPPVIDRDGPVKAVGLTALELERDLQQRYRKYYLNLTVTVRTENRFFFVQGEVRDPNRYIHSGATTVLGAIAAARGFTDFAKRSKVRLRRANGQEYTIDCEKALRDSKRDIMVYPGDHIYVPRRYI